MDQVNTHLWTLADRIPETATVTTLVLEPHSERPPFIAGQYVTVILPGHDPVEGKAYSISSAPSEAVFTISVQRLGHFSSTLLDLPVGETITTTAPYGFFYPEPEDPGPLVFIAGGVGVTPAWSILKHLQHDTDPRQRYLFYSNQTAESVAFKDAVHTLAAASDGRLVVTQFLTQETPTGTTFRAGRLQAADVTGIVGDTDAALFFLSGSMSFTRGVWNTLRAAGIKPEQIYTEGFF